MRLLGQVFVCLIILAAGAFAPADARAAPYAAIVMDMRDGKVFHARSADRRQHPASLTKMMTLYLAFEAVEKGQLRLDQKVRISRHAARQPASKIYLKAGSRATIRSLMRAAAIKSANDAAMALAEAIGGSQANFARMMTQKARALGMRNTTFKNPHGLTQKGHLSTARDMARLARHLYFDFPEYYGLFGKRSDMAYGKRIWTTNRLLGSYRGAEGMKTGYTRAAGYNLVATASRGSERVIAVVMGGKSSRTRNAQVAKLLDLGFRNAPSRVAIVKPRAGSQIQVARAPMPRPKPGVPATGLVALGQALAPASAVASTAPANAIPARVIRGTKHAPEIALLPVPRPGSGAARIARSDADWAAELGAFDDEAEAVALINAVTLAGPSAFPEGSPRIVEIDSQRGKLYHVTITGLEPGEAHSACSTLIAHGRDCIPVGPER